MKNMIALILSCLLMLAGFVWLAFMEWRIACALGMILYGVFINNSLDPPSNPSTT